MINRTTAPRVNGELGFKFPELKTTSTSNGIKIISSFKPSAPLINFRLTIRKGSIYDLPELNGTSLLTTRMIDEGAGKYDSLELNQEISYLGTHLSINCDNENIYFSLTSLSEYFEQSLYLLSEIIKNPHFTQDDFDREKDTLLNSLKLVQAYPDFIAEDSFKKLMFGNNNYGIDIFGDLTTLSNITLQDIKDLYKNYYSPTDAIITVVGNIESKLLLDSIEKHFVGWINNSLNSFQPNLELTPTLPGTYFLNFPGSVQSEIRVGLLTPQIDLNNYPAILLNIIFGGDISSRLNQVLREKEGITYGAYSYFEIMQNISALLISTSVDLINSFKAINLIKQVIDDIRKNITEEELSYAKSKLINKLPLRFESILNLNSSINHLEIMGLGLDYYDNYTAKINSVSLNDVQNLASELFVKENFIFFLTGDKEKFFEINLNEEIFEVDSSGGIINSL
ncbi:MAG: insulinase family protein [Melioribacteraceae bacterium]|nr:insulinase family protein [Melioribacteraceae bacterium]